MLEKNSIYSKITLIIVAYKSRDNILSNLKAMENFKTIVVDNSNDLVFKNTLSKYKNIRYECLNKNIGFGKANNFGVSLATTEYVLILNPDIKIDPDAISQLFNAFSKYKNVGVAGPILLDELQNVRTNSSLSYLKKIKKRSLFEKNIFKTIEKKESSGDFCADYIIGCAMLFTKNFYLSIGGFNQKFFIFFEDNEICERIRKKGFLVIETFDSKMIHYEGKSGEYTFFEDCRLKIAHKFSEYTYLNINKKKLSLYILINFFDYFQRFLVNLFRFRFRNSLDNFLRMVSIFLYIIFKLRY